MGKNLAGISVSDSGPQILGIGWLCAFQCELDLQNSVLRYKIIDKPNPPVESEAMLGALLNYSDGGAKIELLKPEPAGALESGGLKLGDVITRFGEVEKGAIYPGAINTQLIKSAGKTMAVEYIPAGEKETRKSTIRLPALQTQWNHSR